MSSPPVSPVVGSPHVVAPGHIVTAPAVPTTQPQAIAFTTPMPFSSASLYVGDLSPEIGEANLFEIFNTIGPVASIRVCRDVITRRSLGYAYVNFHTSQDAERALNTLNNTEIKGRSCRISWSQRDPALRKSGKGNIFIKNLDKSIDNKALHDTFIQFGTVLSCKIELDDKGQSKGYGYIQYATQESAQSAISKVNGMALNSKKVFVGSFVPRKERMELNSSKKFTNVFIKNVSEKMEDDQIKLLFSQFGPIKSAVVMRDDQGKSKGFGFVNFENPEDAEVAVRELNEKEVEGKQVFVGRAQKKAERESELRSKFEQIKIEQMSKYQGVNLYIKNLEDNVDDDKLREIFASFGTITSSKVMKDPKGNSKGFGFVCFTNSEEATKAYTDMNGKIVGSKPLYVALAQRKDQRKSLLEAQFAQRGKIPARLPNAPIYPNGTPNMFYAQGPGQPFVYPQMVPRGRFPPGPYQPMPGSQYVMVTGGGGRGQVVKNARGGSVAPRRGMKQQQPVAHQSVPVPIAQVATPVIQPLNAQLLASLPEETQKNMVAESLFALINKANPSLAGKITGMILESCSVEEMLQMIEKPDIDLKHKIDEAVIVLKEHSSKQNE